MDPLLAVGLSHRGLSPKSLGLGGRCSRARGHPPARLHAVRAAVVPSAVCRLGGHRGPLRSRGPGLQGLVGGSHRYAVGGQESLWT